MNNLLVGNGINIQFNKTDYTTQQIVLRILKNCDRDDFPSHIIVNFPYLLKNYIGQLFLEARDILEDKYDNFTNCTAEDESLKSFKKQYADKIDTYIEKLSSYMASSGKQYSSHAATIRSWALRDHPAPVKRTYECKEDESL